MPSKTKRGKIQVFSVITIVNRAKCPNYDKRDRFLIEEHC